MRVAIYSRGVEKEQLEDMKLLFDALSASLITPVLYQPFYDQLKQVLDIDTSRDLFNSFYDLDESIECLISLGGDGTLLDTVSLVRDKSIPVLGINFGRLGFLASMGRDDVAGVVKALENRTFVTDKRTLIHLDSNISLFGEVPYALNEFAIQKRDSSSMLKIHTYLNGEFLNTYWADGIIVSSPTGSTGYSLSCNGPIVFPDSAIFVITPIAPHNLNVRPIVVPDTTVISFEVEGRTDHFICTLDSRKEIVDKTVQLAIKKEEFPISLVRLNENNFLQTLRNKLSWGLDTRN